MSFVYDFDWNILLIEISTTDPCLESNSLRPQRCLRNGLSRSWDSSRSWKSSRKIRSSVGQINYVLHERVTRNVSRDTTS